jgi:hypothetical protein
MGAIIESGGVSNKPVAWLVYANFNALPFLDFSREVGDFFFANSFGIIDL